MTRIACEVFPAPTNQKEAEQWLFEAGETQREIAVFELACKEKLAEVKKGNQEVVLRFEQRLQKLAQGISTYANGHRLDFCKDGRKTVRFVNGEFTWRNQPSTVRILDGLKALESIEKQELGEHFIRTSETLNKQALRADPQAVEKIEGVEIVHKGEAFYIKPYPTEGKSKEIVVAQTERGEG